MPFTVTEIVAVLSLTVPLSAGEVLFVFAVFVVIEGAVRSMTSALFSVLFPTLPAASVAVVVML